MTTRAWSNWRLGAALGSVVGFLLLAVVLVVRAASPAPDGAADSGPPSPSRVEYPGLVRPPARPSAEATLPDADPIIGVVVDGKARAYLLSGLSRPQTHVVNDLLAGRPVTVTYCDRKDCAAVFTADGTNPLEVGTGGYEDGLLLLLNGHLYRQDSGDGVDSRDRFPHPRLECVRTTWKEWREAHPETDVVGG